MSVGHALGVLQRPSLSPWGKNFVNFVFFIFCVMDGMNMNMAGSMI